MLNHARAWLLRGAIALNMLSPAAALDNPLTRGPLADFINVFREQAIPRQVVIWRHPEFKKGTIVVSTKERRLYYVLVPRIIDPDLPKYMAGGIDNPLGARALYLGSSQYRIHGSNEPDTMGAAVSSGCIRMTNRDVVDLYSRAKVGTKVVVLK